MKHNTKRVTEFLNAIDWFFGINNYDKVVTVVDKQTEMKGNKTLIAEIEMHEDYQTLDVKLLPAFFEQSLATQRKALLHELCHTITMPAKSAMCDLQAGLLVTPDCIRQINEEMTSKIENKLDGLFCGRFKYASKAYSDYLLTKKTPRKGKKPLKKGI